MTLSVTVITLNEVENLKECLDSVAFADEIIVVDSGSTDGTLELARCHTDHVVAQQWLGYGAQKNRASGLVHGDWILNLDADERVSLALRDEIVQVVRNESPHAAYEIPRRNYVLGRWLRYGGWYPDHVIRLWRRDQAHWGDVSVHEKLTVQGSIGVLRNHLEHYTYRNLNEYFLRQCRYAQLAAEQRYAYGFRTSLAGLPFKAVTKFVQLYLWKRGFLDGRLGLLMALLGSLFAVARDAMLWEIQQQSRNVAPETKSPQESAEPRPPESVATVTRP